MKISASIYARAAVGDVHGLEATVRALDAHRVDYLHVDCADDPAVFEDIRRIRSWSRTPIDLHLIAADPQPYFPLLRALDVELISIQAEQLEVPLSIPEDLAPRFGWACTSDTPIEAFAQWRRPLGDTERGGNDRSHGATDQHGSDGPELQAGFVLFMATTPGKSGGRFDARTFRRIRDFRRRFPGVPIHVDGGVDEEVGFILRNHGVRAAVTGSFILAADPASSASPRSEHAAGQKAQSESAQVDPWSQQLGARLVALHKAAPMGAVHSTDTAGTTAGNMADRGADTGADTRADRGPDKAAAGSAEVFATASAAASPAKGLAEHSSDGRFRVADFMLQADELPVLPWPETDRKDAQPSFAELLRCIEDHALGFALLQKPDGRLAGLVANADVRRALLQHLEDLNAVRVADCINPTPFCARSQQSVPKLLQAIKACPFPIAYCPVLDENDRLVGALPFNNLIKGEA
jgi:pentose-5-phosphate-3-epimerase